MADEVSIRKLPGPLSQIQYLILAGPGCLIRKLPGPLGQTQYLILAGPGCLDNG